MEAREELNLDHGAGIGHHAPDLQISAGVVTRVLAIWIAILTVLHFIAMAAPRVISWERITRESDIVQLFDFDYERSVPTWYSGVMVAVCGLMLILIGSGYLRGGQMRFGAYWLLLGVIFLGLSFDEIVAIHEQWIVPVRDLFGITGGIFYFAWVVPAVILMALLLGALVPFLTSLPVATRTQFLVAGAVFVGGAVGMELVSGFYVSTGEGQGDSLVYRLLTTVEELLEMTGILLFFRALLVYIPTTTGTVRITSQAP